jgi:1-acyl-sn-glycerol-3-phosphate acyltransferase
MKNLRPAVILAAFAALTLPLMPVQQVFVWFWPSMARRFPMHYHRLVLRVLGIRLKLEGLAIAQGPALIVSNHVSWLDITVLSAIAPLSFVAKREVNGWPFFGSLARLQRTVFVDRDKRHTTAGVRDEMMQRLKQGDILVLFAEGTSGDGSRVLPFKSSFFAAADVSGIPVHPVTLAYNGHWGLPMNRRSRPLYAWYGDMDLGSHLWEALASGPVEVTAVCHAPLPHGTGRKIMARTAEESVRKGLVHALAGSPVHSPVEMR